jgi:uncharacterized membrane protein YgaE (UPF0421/DUF939 family)
VNTSNFKIFGQEPAAFVGVVQAVLTMLLSFGVLGLTPETNGVILAAVSASLGLVAAYATRTTLYTALLGFVQAVLVLAVTFGLRLDDMQQGAILSTLAVVAGLYLRDKTSSVDSAVSNASPGTLVADAMEAANVTPVPVVNVETSP